ncbi:MAG: hypothetical protein O2954_18635 [bacterium]|nr:hypothetical protein [bacterium]
MRRMLLAWAEEREFQPDDNYVGEAKDAGQEKLEGAKEFILSLVSDGERHRRQELLEKGIKARFGRQTLETARKEPVEAGELADGKQGREAYVWAEKNVTTVPHVCNVSEAEKDFSTVLTRRRKR